MLGVFQESIDTYNEKTGQVVGGIAAVVILIALIVWLVKRSRKS